MLRRFHSIPGLAFGVVLTVLGATGAVLSLDPALERAGAVSADSLSVADLASIVQSAIPGVERIDRRANGAIIVTWSTDTAVGSDEIDPRSGAVIAGDAPSPVMRWIRDLHRSMLLGDPGRMGVGATAAAMAVLACTGLLLLAVVQGGWRRLSAPLRGATGAGWLHATLGRLALALMLGSALTGTWMSLATFDLVEDGRDLDPEFPFEVAGTAPAPVSTLAALRAVPLADLRRLTFPQPHDPQDVFGLQTVDGSGYVDQATGAALNWLPHSAARTAWEWVYALHTGQGLWWVGLAFGLGGLALPFMAVSGTMIWARRRASRPRIRGNVAAGTARTIILVGSEGGSTWGFADTLHKALAALGERVHVAPMNALRSYPQARHIFILTATYGDGAAPSSASHFLDRLARMQPGSAEVTVLGFGDRLFPQFCGFAESVSAVLVNRGWTMFHPLARIDRQSAVDFATWGQSVGAVMGIDLVLDHRTHLPRLSSFQLISREDFGQAVQAPVAILRFAAAKQRRFPRFGTGLPAFRAGDLIGIVPPGSDLPRFYSLASSRADGWLEICVREAPGGLCSGFLHDLAPGDEIRGFIRHNPAFRPRRGKTPVILVAAGCGIGPMAGFLRRMQPGRDSELYFGARDPDSDYLYRDELARWQSENRLTRLVTAFSRTADHRYVQDCLRDDAAGLREKIVRGGQILVCGGAAMARGVAEEVNRAIAPLGLTVAALKSEGRYLEDVY